MALQALKDLEREVLIWETSNLGTTMRFPSLGPHNVRGIELNSYAAELARLSIWIGEIQWMISNGFAYLRDPILRPLHAIECRDAVLDVGASGGPVAATWPDAEFIIGNPPFLGGKLMRGGLGDAYVDPLFRAYSGRVPPEADFVCYWFEVARWMIESGRTRRVGLLATQGIRGGASRRVLDQIKHSGDIFVAWADERWVVDGAMVHVSVVGFDDGTDAQRRLNGEPVAIINSNLTSGVDTTHAPRLTENLGVAFMGDTKGGLFDIADDEAKGMIGQANPDGRKNADVVHPWVNGRDLTQSPRGMWIIDFGVNMEEQEAALYEAPFGYIERAVMPVRIENRRASYATRWWLHAEPRPAMRKALAPLSRYLATPYVAKHRVFVWLPTETLPDHEIIVFAREDDFFFGVLQSRIHELWARSVGTQVREAESGFRYTPTTTFETFPLPPSAGNALSEVERAARTLNLHRTGWLNPGGASSTEERGRTLTGLYNESPAWLRMDHEVLDRAVAAAYGWEWPLQREEILTRLLALNLARGAKEGELSLPVDADVGRFD